mmetsp:Transcript_17204/g.53248  ORF Transcript_17204/g.53248 Transcript_17204/m.53248 type:complete len:224 (+) Transcript_17204:111-782(+)
MDSGTNRARERAGQVLLHRALAELPTLPRTHLPLPRCGGALCLRTGSLLCAHARAGHLPPALHGAERGGAARGWRHQTRAEGPCHTPRAGPVLALEPRLLHGRALAAALRRAAALVLPPRSGRARRGQDPVCGRSGARRAQHLRRRGGGRERPRPHAPAQGPRPLRRHVVPRSRARCGRLRDGVRDHLQATPWRAGRGWHRLCAPQRPRGAARAWWVRPAARI